LRQINTFYFCVSLWWCLVHVVSFNCSPNINDCFYPTCICSCIWILYGAANFKSKLYLCIPLQSYRFISEISFDTCSEFRWISLADILEFKQPTWMKFQSVFNSVIICAVWGAILYACNQCLWQKMSFNSSSGS